jgi:hypothetical protein
MGTVPKTDTGGWIEYIKVYWDKNVEGTRQNDSVTSGERVLTRGASVARSREGQLFIKNTRFCEIKKMMY